MIKYSLKFAFRDWKNEFFTNRPNFSGHPNFCTNISANGFFTEYTLSSLDFIFSFDFCFTCYFLKRFLLVKLWNILQHSTALTQEVQVDLELVQRFSPLQPSLLLVWLLLLLQFLGNKAPEAVVAHVYLRKYQQVRISHACLSTFQKESCLFGFV